MIDHDKIIDEFISFAMGVSGNDWESPIRIDWGGEGDEHKIEIVFLTQKALDNFFTKLPDRKFQGFDVVGFVSSVFFAYMETKQNG